MVKRQRAWSFYTATRSYSVKASKEVILSGGVINSPQLLELSGIGDPEVLKAAGVDCKIENNRVGYASSPPLRSLLDVKGQKTD